MASMSGAGVREVEARVDAKVKEQLCSTYCVQMLLLQAPGPASWVRSLCGCGEPGQGRRWLRIELHADLGTERAQCVFIGFGLP